MVFLERLKSKDQCMECNEGYQLSEDFECRPFTCSTGPKTGCKVCRGRGLLRFALLAGWLGLAL